MEETSLWIAALRTAKDEAILATRLFNDPAETRAFEAFVVHMHVAWLYLLQAKFERDGVDCRYPSDKNPGEFIRVDGEDKRWELARCVQERWTNPADPARKNLEFFIGLRNKIEHRPTPTGASFVLACGGNAQALLLNFENELTAAFGIEHSLAEYFRVPLFIGGFTTAGEEVLRSLRSQLPDSLKKFIADFHSGLDDETIQHPEFDLRLRVVLESAQRGSDAIAMKFTRWDDMSDEEKQAVEALGRRGQTVVREQPRQIVGHGLLRPGEAQKRVQDLVPFKFNSHHFSQSVKRKSIRPPNGASHPERTDEKYCIYDHLSKQYGYTEAWVKWLVKNCSDSKKFVKTTGREAQPK
ncbi:DUF3644 domain-containing protein [Nocardia sp. NPDC057272]|uniref:DUF3644 domain-containing protein n=1 Tax=Nocardia sp. NPDC057272 TaxID=3346079 RepID=UPI00362CB148